VAGRVNKAVVVAGVVPCTERAVEAIARSSLR